ncbi:hypothetical protein WICPIJ_008178 [Wickerhamomyces pijperi]|uniref:RNA polymerase II transcription factor B subunit 2 n=1 Tax=Wickerhamomyces pijperi TaxID=599730 RepID=A0A9P8PYH8_WICPI|nr:hypothetical protein WICPIJ_008178 [Wickerhamomyces pijperi]
MASNLFKLTVNDYLEGLPEATQSKLYQSPATCLAIFRLLPNLAKFYIMTMIFNEKPVRLLDLDTWVKPQKRAEQVEGIRSIKSLHILKDNGEVAVLNPKFRENLKNVLTGVDIGVSFGAPCETEDSNKVDISFLDTYASNKWETILHFMVGTELNEFPSKGVLHLLRHSGLMTGGTPKAMVITNEGFQFLLQDVNAQIWTLLLQYLRMAESLQMDPVDVLNFIFMLGSLELGKDYSTSVLSETQLNLLRDLKDYGLIYQRKDSSKRFYPTRLATTLTSDATTLKSASTAMSQVIKSATTTTTTSSNKGNTSGSQESSSTAVSAASSTIENAGSIIIETNFKLYAYTNSPLQIAILNLFVHLKSRFANLVTGQITRESVRKALLNGITAEQMIAYLETHAHPQLRKTAEEVYQKKIQYDANTNEKFHLIQPNITDQIKLWQLELDRILTWDGYLFTDFSNEEEYQVLQSYAEEIGVMLWCDHNKRKFFVTKEGNAQVIAYANRKLRKGK